MPPFAERLAATVAEWRVSLADLERWLLPSACLLCEAPVPPQEGDALDDYLVDRNPAALRQFLHTDSLKRAAYTELTPLVEALGPGAVRGIGSDLTLVGGGTFGVGAYALPSLHLASWNFTGNAQG